MKKLKWITITTYIEKETGDVLTKAQVEKDFRKIKCIKKHTKTKYDGTTETGLRNYDGTREIIWECTRTGKQLKIW